MDDQRIIVVSKDKVKFATTAKELKLCSTFTGYLDAFMNENNEVITLPANNVGSEQLRIILDWCSRLSGKIDEQLASNFCNLGKDVPIPKQDSETKVYEELSLIPWERTLLSSLPLSELAKLIISLDFLGALNPYHKSVQKFAQRLRGQAPGRLRTILGLRGEPPTEAEKEMVRKRNVLFPY